MSEWQTMETAPKDGTNVLLYVGDGATVTVTGGFWDDHPKCRCWIAGGYMRKMNPPTHWMPLPEPPTRNIPLRDPYMQTVAELGE